MQSFLSILSLVRDESLKLKLNTSVLECITESGIKLDSPVTVQIGLGIAKYLGSTVNALTPLDQERQVSELILGSVYASKLDRVEQQVQYLTECRAAFSHLDLVHVNLVREINNLSAVTPSQDRGIHQAMTAYAFITIPSIRSPQTRLELYIRTAETAFQKKCYEQGEACLKGSTLVVSRLPELEKEDGGWFSGFLELVLRTVSAVQELTDEKLLQITKELVSALFNVKWKAPKEKNKVQKAILNILQRLEEKKNDDIL
ncbi:UPF0505 protein C16orf62 [Eurytemora carolleeae]|uniref:UPF0505 protein C16orf62 n=1 Tax=Eurytemora carolleeae TaxID=1294199 RepID=UPI000C769F22|nr:UPF0505 protein C16orf62 [Eurytemora carolleeae]|eukprot:XP_023343661.1 UPF0505 protein C16orf62-like [Eurytemora affinis]